MSQTDWEQHYREQHTPWDKGEAAPPLLEWMESNPGKIGGKVFVPGAGLGHDVRAIWEHNGDKMESVVGFDISPTAVETANEIPKAGTEEYRQGDLFELDEDLCGRFDWVWEHTCFCAIDPNRRDDYVEAIWKSLRPGGSLLAVFYLNPYDDEHQPGEGPPHGCTEQELEERFVGSGKFSIREKYVPTRSYPGREGLELVVRMEKVS